MTAYAVTLVTSTPKVAKLESAGTGLGLVFGTCTITNYNGTTPVEITGITGAFKGAPIVIPSSVAGYVIKWDASAKAFRAYVTSTDTQCADNVTTIPAFQFIAVGLAP